MVFHTCPVKRTYKRFRNNGKRGKVNTTKWIVPTGSYPLGLMYQFPQAGVVTISSADEIDAFPKRLSSLSLDFACASPTYVKIRMWSAGSEQLQTIPLIVSTTNRHFNLRMPRNVEFTLQKCKVEIEAGGELLVTGRVTFSYKSPFEPKYSFESFDKRVKPDVVNVERHWRNELMR